MVFGTGGSDDRWHYRRVVSIRSGPFSNIRERARFIWCDKFIDFAVLRKRMSKAQNIRVPEPPPKIDSMPEKGKFINGWIVAWSGVGLFTIACLLFGLWHARSIHLGKIDAANQRVSAAITAANKWLVGDSLNNVAAIEMSLIEAMAADHVSDIEIAQAVLQQVRVHRNRLEDRQRSAAAEKEASLVFENAQDTIKRGDGKKAILVLKQYLANNHAKQKVEAQQLSDELSVAIEDSLVLDMLVDLDAEKFALAEKFGTINDHRVSRPELKGILNQTVRRVLPDARKKRDAIRAKQEKLAKEKAHKDLLRKQAEDLRRKQAEEKRRLDELERNRDLEAIARDPSDLEKFLHAGEFTNAQLEFQTRLLDDPNNDDSRFQLALTQFFQSVERFGQSLYRFGVKKSVDDIPFLRLPIPENPTPSQITYANCRMMLNDLIRDLDAVDTTLSGVTAAKTEVPLRLGVIRFDMNGDGKATQELNSILKTIHREKFTFLRGNEALLVHFDRGDVSWLRIYCQLMAAVLDGVLAFDWEPAFNDGARELFDDPKIGKRKMQDEDAIQIVEPRRLDRVRRRLILVTKLNREMWTHIRAEKDNRFEWLPNSTQRSVLGFTVNDKLVDSWLEAVEEVGMAFKGDRVVPKFWRWERNGKGINLKNVLQNPPKLIDQSFFENLPDNLPDEYFTDGKDFNINTLIDFFNNYQAWF